MGFVKSASKGKVKINPNGRAVAGQRASAVALTPHRLPRVVQLKSMASELNFTEKMTGTC